MDPPRGLGRNILRPIYFLVKGLKGQIYNGSWVLHDKVFL